MPLLRKSRLQRNQHQPKLLDSRIASSSWQLAEIRTPAPPSRRSRQFCNLANTAAQSRNDNLRLPPIFANLGTSDRPKQLRSSIQHSVKGPAGVITVSNAGLSMWSDEWGTRVPIANKSRVDRKIRIQPYPSFTCACLEALLLPSCNSV